MVADAFADHLKRGYDIHPTIAVTKARIDMPEIGDAIEAGRLEGGTWAAGRAVAADLRPGGGPPIRINSDGTVF